MILEDIKSKRIKKNYRFTGPDYYGCINSGMAPAIARWADKWNGSKFDVYAVGPDAALEIHRSEIKRDRLMGINKRQYGDDPRRMVKVFKTAKPAKELFIKLCDKVLEENRIEGKTHQELSRKANNGDLEAALSLMDY